MAKHPGVSSSSSQAPAKGQGQPLAAIALRRTGVILWILAAVALLVFSILPVKLTPLYIFVLGRITLDEILHFVAFGGLALSAALVFARPRHFVLGTATFLFLALLSEVIQEFIPNRAFAWNDLLADLSGFATGLGVGIGLRLAFRRGKAT